MWFKSFLCMNFSLIFAWSLFVICFRVTLKNVFSVISVLWPFYSSTWFAFFKRKDDEITFIWTYTSSSRWSLYIASNYYWTPTMLKSSELTMVYILSCIKSAQRNNINTYCHHILVMLQIHVIWYHVVLTLKINWMKMRFEWYFVNIVWSSTLI